MAPDRRVRDGLASLLSATGLVDVLTAAADGHAILRLSASRQPDVIVLDPGAVERDDGAIVARLRRHAPGARILVLEWDGRTEAVLPRGADGVLDASALPGALLDALASGGPASD